jgi:hypothetical protein
MVGRAGPVSPARSLRRRWFRPARTAKPTPQQIAAFRGCAEKNQDAIGEGERCACTFS